MKASTHTDTTRPHVCSGPTKCCQPDCSVCGTLTASTHTDRPLLSHLAQACETAGEICEKADRADLLVIANNADQGPVMRTAARAELVARYSCRDCGAAAGRECKADYGCLLEMRGVPANPASPGLSGIEVKAAVALIALRMGQPITISQSIALATVRGCSGCDGCDPATCTFFDTGDVLAGLRKADRHPSLSASTYDEAGRAWANEWDGKLELRERLYHYSTPASEDVFGGLRDACTCEGEMVDTGDGESGPMPVYSCTPDEACPSHGRHADPAGWAEADTIERGYVMSAVVSTLRLRLEREGKSPQAADRRARFLVGRASEELLLAMHAAAAAAYGDGDDGWDHDRAAGDVALALPALLAGSRAPLELGPCGHFHPTA
jgi:hypothetical protein